MSRLVLSLLWLATLTAEPLAAESTVSGVVRYEDGTAAHGASVELFRGEDLLEAAWTDGKGWFAFALVPPSGEYQVITRQPGLEPTSTPLKLSENSSRVQLAIELREQSDAALDDETKRLKFREHLDALEEPPFCSGSSMERNLVSYRFLWLRSFHNPVIVTFTLDDVAPIVTYKERRSIGRLSVERSDLVAIWRERMAGEERITESVRGVLSDFREYFAEGFWSAPSYLEGASIPLDGSLWVVEGNRDGRCHLAIRHTPPDGDAVRDLSGELLFGLADRDFPYTEVY